MDKLSSTEYMTKKNRSLLKTHFVNNKLDIEKIKIAS